MSLFDLFALFFGFSDFLEENSCYFSPALTVCSKNLMEFHILIFLLKFEKLASIYSMSQK